MTYLLVDVCDNICFRFTGAQGAVRVWLEDVMGGTLSN